VFCGKYLPNFDNYFAKTEALAIINQQKSGEPGLHSWLTSEFNDWALK
jgi:hypothetical protein